MQIDRRDGQAAQDLLDQIGDVGAQHRHTFGGERRRQQAPHAPMLGVSAFACEGLQRRIVDLGCTGRVRAGTGQPWIRGQGLGRGVPADQPCGIPNRGAHPRDGGLLLQLPVSRRQRQQVLPACERQPIHAKPLSLPAPRAR
ncbi:hypothetical protein GCM10027176_13730 [Actinoallomurus bryophytorum]|uniref:hypothetical protein n=1 Tax=Actinoallomurus bryophytorum TaxID=1490222 RepID=UPI001FE2E2DC|nr:hypothetical protein [Actinoallomurus bryophytorum]